MIDNFLLASRSMNESKTLYEEAQNSANELKGKLVALEEEKVALEKSLAESKVLLENAARATSAENEATVGQLEAKCADAEKAREAMRDRFNEAVQRGLWIPRRNSVNAVLMQAHD